MALLEVPTGTLLFYYKDIKQEIVHKLLLDEYGVSKRWVIIMHDDDCFYYHSWRNNVVIAFGTLSSFLT